MRRRTLLITPAVAAAATMITPMAGFTPAAYAAPAVTPGVRVRERTVRPITGQTHVDGRPVTADTGTRASAAPSAKTWTLTVAVLDRSGAVAAPTDRPTVIIQNLDLGDVFYWGAPGPVDLPEGRYSITADVATARTGADPAYSVLTHPELRLDRHRTVTLDARAAQRVSVEPDDLAARGGSHDVMVFTQVADSPFPLVVRYVFDPRFDEVYAATIPGTQSAAYAFGQARRATEPTVDLVAGGTDPFGVRAEWLDPGFEAEEDRAGVIAVHAEQIGKGDLTGRLVVIEVPGDLPYADLLTMLTELSGRGARLALVVPRGAGSAFYDGDLSALPLPVLVGWGTTGDRFAALTRSGAQRVSYASSPRPRLRYELAYGVTGRLVTPQIYRPGTATLAALPVSYHDGEAGSARFAHAGQVFFGSTVRAMWSTPTAAPQQRIEYFTPGRWELTVTPYGRPGGVVTGTYDLRAGLNPAIAWDKPVFSPSLSGTTRTRAGERPWAYRDADAIDVILPLFGDASGRPVTPSAGLDSGSISLHREGVLVDSVPVPDAARFAVPAEPASYRLTASVTRDQPWWHLATRIDAEWLFRSSAADAGMPLPLLAVRFDPALSLRNRAPAGPFAFPATVTTAGSGTASLTVEASFDDGATWRPAGVTGSGNRFTVRLVQPASGYVSLRASVTLDATTRQRLTVLRAYALGR
ncbi:hypothetical protein HDA40_006917 [Hamadaea flava]|uniref:Uncharacterized protein n=1 Tax=Hamadaea flava TaxID=1742688 RepID=A0ABV8M0M2_9ACTN|nr:hypothetical protein [Hamadaea flava]MCP2328410.1 hypothetical protein [Hamadaea flava]